MTYPEQLSELIEDFKSIDDRMERLEYVFDLASEVNELPTLNGMIQPESQAVNPKPMSELILRTKRPTLSGADSKLVQGLMGILTIAIDQQPIDSTGLDT